MKHKKTKFIRHLWWFQIEKTLWSVWLYEHFSALQPIEACIYHCHLHPLQAANCCRNSPLVVDEDDLRWTTNVRSKTLGCRKIKYVFGDVKWCFKALWGLKGLRDQANPWSADLTLTLNMSQIYVRQSDTFRLTFNNSIYVLVTGNCGSRQRDTLSSDWKFQFNRSELCVISG